MSKINGLFLQGGGAKGAFQVGALQVFLEKGIDFQVIAGTSIGAINGMIIYFHGLSRLQEVWTKMAKIEYATDPENIVLETKEAVKNIAKYLSYKRDSNISHFYVNYAPVKDSKISHEFKDMVNCTDEEIVKYVRASSLLPNFIQWGSLLSSGKSQQEIFMQKIAAGVYNDYLMDGGVVNNKFMEPFMETEVDRIYGIVFDKNFIIPEYIWEKYDKDQVIIIKPDFDFEADDTMKFDSDHFQKWVQAGYLQAQKSFII